MDVPFLVGSNKERSIMDSGSIEEKLMKAIFSGGQKGNLNKNHWECPYCNVLVPDYRKKKNSLITKVSHHLQKRHYDLGKLEIESLLEEISTGCAREEKDNDD